MFATYVLDKIALIILSLCICIFCIPTDAYVILALLMTVSCYATCYYVGRDGFTGFMYGIKLALAFFIMPFCFFIPMITYDIFTTKYKNMICLFLLPLLWHLNDLDYTASFLIALDTALAILLSYRSNKLHLLESEYLDLRDENREAMYQLNIKNNELMEKQDYEVHMATLKERNRIAREIHDNVGHILSRTLLQIGALLAITKNDTERESLTDIKLSLNTAMTSIRESVHDLHDDSINLYYELNELVEKFTFCPVHFEYNITHDFDRKSKYSILAVAKEAFSNIAKHSNATKVEFYLVEHPSLYQFLIHDNGTNATRDLDSSGIGLQNIRDRVENMEGTLHVTTSKGFRIFISIPNKNAK